MNSSQWAIRDAVLMSSSLAPGFRESDVFPNRAVEEEIVLHDDAEELAVIAQLQIDEVLPVHLHVATERPIEGHHQPDQRALARA